MAEDLAEDTRAEADATPEKEYRRWMLELKLADRREKKWREQGRQLMKVYRAQQTKKSTFPILWSNTEVLRPALYNSAPKPDVRRRFRDADVLGKAVSEVCERSLTYCVDAYDLDNVIQNDVLDALLPGRGVSRLRYIPIYRAKAGANPGATVESKEGAEAPHRGEGYEGEREEVEYEQALCEHIGWEDYRQGPGDTWEEVAWVGFRCRLTKDDLIEKFGKEKADRIKLNDVDFSDEQTEKSADELKEVFKRAELWEIWDRDSGKVFFVNESYQKGVLNAIGSEDGAPPLKFKNFFPIPRPLQLIEDTGTLIPIPPYEMYRKQAEELDSISTRINKIIAACRVRFIYDATLSELKQLMDSQDNDGIPAEQARAWLANGGVDKAIWWMPIEQVAAVLKELYVARDQSKQVIYEITGISDILRGVTNPNETLGAQQLKANSASLRVQRMQREVQRYVRDLVRLLAEVVGENFSQQTLAQMTGLNFPTALQKQRGQMTLQLLDRVQGAVPPDKQQQLRQMMSMPSWEDILGVLRSDMQREYRIDIETDSTVAQSLQQDMEGLREVITALVEFWQGVGPAVTSGALSMEAVKSISLSIVRRARMGLEVEDAIETGTQQPQPQADPNAAKAQADQVKAQHDAQVEQMKQQNEMAIAAREQQFEQQKAALEAQLEQQRHAFEARLEQDRNSRDDAFNRWKVEQDNKTKVQVAEIAAGAAISKAEVEAANAAEQDTNASLNDDGTAAQATTRKRNAPIDKLAAMHAEQMAAHSQTIEAMGKMAEAMTKPRVRKIVRGPDGKASHAVETVN